MLKSSKFEDKENVDPHTGLPICRRRWLTSTTAASTTSTSTSFDELKEKKRAPFSDITPISRELSFGGSAADGSSSPSGDEGGDSNVARGAGFEIHTGKLGDESEAAAETAAAASVQNKSAVSMKKRATKTKRKKSKVKRSKGLALRMNENVGHGEDERHQHQQLKRGARAGAAGRQRKRKSS